MAGQSADDKTKAGLPRKRRAYQRSQKGCRNCKLRSVKCDENKPQCTKCVTYGVLCSYADSGPALQSSSQSFQEWHVTGLSDVNPKGTASRPAGQSSAPQKALSLPVASENSSSRLELTWQSVDQLRRFEVSTVHLIGGQTFGEVAERALHQYSLSYPCLMHTILAVTALHDRYANTTNAQKDLSAVNVHYAQGAKLLSEALSRKLDEGDFDPLWTTAALLSMTTYGVRERPSALQAWPLVDAGPSCLDWLDMSAGKMVVWKLTDPMRPGGMYEPMAHEYAWVYDPGPQQGIDDVPSVLVQLCDLDPSSTAATNAYFRMAHILAALRHMPDDISSKSVALKFFHHMTPEYRSLLHNKEPVALLLLSLWYAKSRKIFWWLYRRGGIELEAICIYLQQYHSHNRAIQDLLPWLALRTPSAYTLPSMIEVQDFA